MCSTKNGEHLLSQQVSCVYEIDNEGTKIRIINSGKLRKV